MELQNIFYAVGGLILLRTIWKSLYKGWKSCPFTVVKDRSRNGMRDIAKEILIHK